ncbi:MAG: hypothetical protein ACLR23_10315 [Clostridia bacterium]
MTGNSGQYTYRCECRVTTKDGSSILVNSRDAVVTVQRGISIGSPTATEQNGSTTYSLTAELLDAGSENHCRDWLCLGNNGQSNPFPQQRPGKNQLAGNCGGE